MTSDPLPAQDVPQCVNAGHCPCDISTRHEWFEAFCAERGKLNVDAATIRTLLAELIQQQAHSTREIVADHLGSEHNLAKPGAGPRRFGHNPSWVKVSELAALLRDPVRPHPDER